MNNIKESIKFHREHNKVPIVSLWVIVKIFSWLIFFELNCNEIKQEWPPPLGSNPIEYIENDTVKSTTNTLQ